MVGSNYTINTQCKHLMPCGWCELKNEICLNYVPIYPHTEDENWYTELDDPKFSVTTKESDYETH